MKKLFDLSMPLWLTILFPKYWLILIPCLFVLNSIVLLCVLKVQKQKNIKEIYKKNILKIILFSFVGYILGGLILSASTLLPTNDITSALTYNPYTNIFSVIYIIITVIISATLIYYLNNKYIFKKEKISSKEKKQILFFITFFSLPYIFFYPTSFMYDSKNDIEVRIGDLKSEYIGNTDLTRIFAESKNYINTKFDYDDKIYEINTESNVGSCIVNMKVTTKFDINNDIEVYKEWVKKCCIALFVNNANFDNIEILLKNGDNETICELKYTKEDIQNSYDVKIEELQNNSEKLQEILNN